MILELDDYEAANLRAALEASRTGGSPLCVLHNGDWLCQILNRIPAVEYKPNATPKQLRASARWRAEVDMGGPEPPE